MTNRDDRFPPNPPPRGPNIHPPQMRPQATRPGGFGSGGGDVQAHGGGSFAGRGTQGFQPQQFRNDGASHFEFGSGSNQDLASHNNNWREDHFGYDDQGFGGDFGTFDEEYSDGGQGYNQGARFNQGYHRPYRQQYQGNRNHGGYRGWV